MADGSDRLAGIVEALDQRDRVHVVGEVPHWSVTARIEHRVEIIGLDVGKPVGVGEDPLRGGIVLEAGHRFGLVARIVAFRVDRRLPTLGRGQGNVDACIPENVIGRSEFLEPESGRFAGIAKLVM
ncbi:hypothetical protein D9M68_199290 [compost metagenome]